MKCKRCAAPAVAALPSHHTAFCENCFLDFFERQVDRAIRKHQLFTREERVLVALSGGKDSLGLMHELARQGYDVTGLHVDLAIPDSSPQARAAVEAFCGKHGHDLRVVELEKEGLSIPLVKERLRRPICSACGKIKRYYFNKYAMENDFQALATGHNLDDEVSRLFANTLRWDAAYLSDQGPRLDAANGFGRKVKPFYRISEFESAIYCFLSGIEYHQSACPFSKGASFTGHKKLWADLEDNSPGQKLNFYETFLKQGKPVFAAKDAADGVPLSPCARCGYPTSADVCGVCRIREAVAGGTEVGEKGER